MAASQVKPLVVIVGPTASGKTALAIEMAERFGGEIICADSRTVYKGMDIGTAKPTADDCLRVSHWGLDLVEPGESFNAADFKRYAEQKIEEIRHRDHVPFLVGGTGLYIDAVIFDYQFGEPAKPALRESLESRSIEVLQKYCADHNIQLPINSKNKRHLIRAIEQKGINNKRKVDPVANIIIVGISTEKDELIIRIQQRTEQIFQNSVVEEATRLSSRYGWNSEAMTGNIYPVIHDLTDEKITLEQAKEKFTTLDWRLAKRQLTWFRRNPHIRWLPLDQAKDYLVAALARVG